MKRGSRLRYIGFGLIMTLISGMWASATGGNTVPALDFDTLVMMRRQPLNPAHVYNYHVEGLAGSVILAPPSPRGSRR